MLQQFILAIMFSCLFLQSSFATNLQQPAVGTHGMVVTSQYLATKVGVSILKQGGNAIDAAVAVGYALAVTDPCCGNIGGGGFMLIHLANGKNVFINFREKAPLNIKVSSYLKNGKFNREKLLHGYLAAGIPGTVMGLNDALKKYGTMKLKKVMTPAIQLAVEGFKIDSGTAKLFAQYHKQFLKQPNVAAIFLDHGQPYKAGEILKQKDLAKTLKLIAQKGNQAFYDGKITAALVKASQQHGGKFSKKDFKNYNISFEKPIICHYRGYTIISAPPPSSGGVTLCTMLKILTPYPLSTWGFHSAKATHVTVEAMRYAYYDRNHYLGDPAFVTNPISWLLSTKHINTIRKNILPNKAGQSNSLFKNFSREKMQTTHYSIVDKYGNAVAVTYTLNGFFGAGVIAGNTGFFLNNEMDDFTSQPGKPNLFGLVQGEKNKIEPGKRPLSSMTPTIVTKHGKVFMVTGAAGGSTIITQVLASIQNVIDYGMNIQKAIDAPRYHMQWLPDVVFREPHCFSPHALKKLQQMGYTFQLGFLNRTYWGVSNAILIEKGKIYGAADSRREGGLALGYYPDLISPARETRADGDLREATHAPLKNPHTQCTRRKRWSIDKIKM